MVQVLRDNGIRVFVLPARSTIATPDSLFPNNWFSHHQEDTLVLYPMLAQNRRHERQLESLLRVLSQIGSKPRIFDFTYGEQYGQILEGTGSMVIDRVGKVAFAAESKRTNKELFYEWCQKMGYEPFLFHAYIPDRTPVYHTNICMSIAEEYALYCPESVKDNEEKKRLEKKLSSLGKEIIRISVRQVNAFCANILQLKSQNGIRKTVMSKTAFTAFTHRQKNILKKYGDLVVLDIPTIEQVGGGGTRCMLAEVF
jgi:hypothetical protein